MTKPTARAENLNGLKSDLSSTVLKCYVDGLYAKQIADKLKITEARVSQITQDLKKLGYLHEKYRDAYKIYEVAEKGKTALREEVPLEVKYLSSGMTTPKIRLHAMQAKMRIVRDSTQPREFWDRVNEGFRNWIPRYKYIPKPIGITINKTPKSIILNIYSRELDNPKEAHNIAWRACLFIQQYLKKEGIILDIWSAQITNQHYAVPSRLAEEIIKKGVYVEVYLGRGVKSILPADKPRKAKAWIDQSKGYPEIESNDLEYATKVIKMPEMVAEMYNMQSLYAENIKLHMNWVKKGIKVFERFEKLLAQRRLKEFI